MVVTTCDKPGDDQRRRAEVVAARCGVPVVRRRALSGLIEAHGTVYVVGRAREALHSSGGAIHVHRGLLAQKSAAGRAHPLIRALAPPGSHPTRVVDGTLGLAEDALHIASILRCRVDAIEAVPAVYSLAESGLQRLADVLPAARDLRLHLAETESWLSEQATASCDAVFLAPMFAKPEAAAPGYASFRSVARHAPMTSRLVEEALRVARDRVVVKLAAAQEIPAFLADYLRERAGLGADWPGDEAAMDRADLGLTFEGGRALTYAILR